MRTIRKYNYKELIMAIQNFLSGGYYGKLGATVGQRWKNKRTIRTYVIPANPRTEKQQKNRGNFANAVEYAQMGLQMNYYATCFEDVNFTRWNYRMRTARELKASGLNGLDLIPLYPMSFVPKVLINEISKASTPSPKHMTFYVPSLSGVGDRTFSMMFELHNENDEYIGLKLYLGYNYVKNPGYLEVDVDDVNEINEHCKVRIVSNDDNNSAEDLIASPTIMVKPSLIDIRDFNDAIVSVQKTTAGITVTFEEQWKPLATTNEISIIANFISNGIQMSASATNQPLEDNNGFCSVKIPLTTELNQNLPAFPNGSSFEVSEVNFSGATWQYTKANDVVPYSDTDLIRTLDAVPTWNAESTADIAFQIQFGATVAEMEKSFNMVCSGRFNTRTPEPQSFKIVGNGSSLTFTCIGSRKNYPMAQDGDGITITAFDVVSNGVTYSISNKNIAVRNNIKESPILETLNWAFYRAGCTEYSPTLENLQLSALVTDYTIDTFAIDNILFMNVKTSAGGNTVVPTSGYGEVWQDGVNWEIDFLQGYEGAEFLEGITQSSAVVFTDGVGFDLNGIHYSLSQEWLTNNAPPYISGYAS